MSLMSSGQVAGKMFDTYGNEFKIHDVTKKGNVEILYVWINYVYLVSLNSFVLTLDPDF